MAGSQEQAKRCGACGAGVDRDAKFCGACGAASNATVDEMIGRDIAGRYRITRRIGMGGMGAVFQAEQISLKRKVALKVLKPELSETEALIRRFNAEAAVAARLNHPNTVTLFDFGQAEDGALFIAMEYIEGKSLRDVLAKHKSGMPMDILLHVAIQVCDSLADAHRNGIVHRDLKPDNIMLTRRGNKDNVVSVLDFGIAKLRDTHGNITAQPMTQAGDLLGTPQYMAPEQIRGDEVDGRTDVYAMGVLLYEMATGALPFNGTTVMQVLSKHLTEPAPRIQRIGVPPDLTELALACMHKQANQRPSSMAQVEHRLRAMSGGRSVHAGRVPVPSPAQPARAMQSPVPGQPTPPVSPAHSPPPVSNPANVALAPMAQTPAPYAPTPAPNSTPSPNQQAGFAHTPASGIHTPAQRHRGAPVPTPHFREVNKGGDRPRARRSRWPWLVLSLLVVAGGAVATLFASGVIGSSRAEHASAGRFEITVNPAPGEGSVKKLDFELPAGFSETGESDEGKVYLRGELEDEPALILVHLLDADDIGSLGNREDPVALQALVAGRLGSRSVDDSARRSQRAGAERSVGRILRDEHTESACEYTAYDVGKQAVLIMLCATESGAPSVVRDYGPALFDSVRSL